MIKLDALTKGEMGLERRGGRGGGSEEARNTKKAVLCVSAYMCDNKRERERANSNKTKDRKDQKKNNQSGQKEKKKRTPEQKRIKESQIQFIVCESKRGRCGSKHPHQSQTAAAPKRSRCLPTWFWLGSDQ